MHNGRKIPAHVDAEPALEPITVSSESSEATGDLSEADRRHLLRAIELSHEARNEGNHPFACILVGSDREVLMDQKNECGLPVPNRVHHAELQLARRAAERYSSDELRDCTLYASTEPCAMCAGAIYWAGIGRVVFGVGERQLLELTGDHPENPTLDLPCREVFARGQRFIKVFGPVLVEEARAAHIGFWADRSKTNESRATKNLARGARR